MPLFPKRKKRVYIVTLQGIAKHSQTVKEAVNLGEEDVQVWIARDFAKCSGCRKCEITCSLSHENKFWPETSRVRIFMLVPGAEFPHLCSQCEDYPCVEACTFKALSVHKKTGAIAVSAQRCVGCGKCIEACPGKIPHIHPKTKKILICDLCNGKPKCAEICHEGGWDCLKTVEREDGAANKLYARTPEETSRNLATKMYGEKAEDLL